MTGRVLADEFGAADGAALWGKRAALVAFGVAAMWISAKIQVASQPVPVTMQTLVVMSLGLAYGARLGAVTMLAYLALGAAGEPVFAATPEKGLGLGYMLGATGGYLVGFVAAAGLVGWLAERGWDRTPVWAAAAMAAGLGAVYACGVAWLGFGAPLGVFGGIGLEAALGAGVMPFLWIDALKLALAVAAFPAVWSLIARHR